MKNRVRNRPHNARKAPHLRIACNGNRNLVIHAIRFEEYESKDEGKTWTKTNSGTEVRTAS